MWYRASSKITAGALVCSDRARRHLLLTCNSLVVIGLLVMLSLFAVPVTQAEMSSGDIEIIQHAIDAKGAKWVAGENAITRMSAEERRALLGSIADTNLIEVQRPDPALGAQAMPDGFSWGDHSNWNWMTSVKDQGGCGSCWAFATCASYEVRERIRVNKPNLYVDVAEQNMVSCWKGDCGGATGTWVMQMFQSQGNPDEVCFPYVSGSEYIPPCDDRCADWPLRMYQVATYGSYYQPGAAAMRGEIMSNGPIQIHIEVFEDFYAYNGGVYEYTTGDYDGGHLVCAYGWDYDNSCWLVKNSWGTDWGEEGPNGQRGWFRLRMGTNEVECESWAFYLTPEGHNYPDLISCTPTENCATGPIADDIVAVFDRDMDPTTLTTDNVFVSGSVTGFHPVTLGYDGPGRALTIDPTVDFLPGERVSVVLSPGVASADGWWLGMGQTWHYNTAVAENTGFFSAADLLTTGMGPIGAATGDLNGDGYADLVTANMFAASVSVKLSNGDGTFAPSVDYAVQNGPLSVAVVDLDGDSDLDLAVPNSQSHTLYVFMNNGDGTFGTPDGYITILSPRNLVAADFDADGDPDIAVVSVESNGVRVHYNNGNGTFGSVYHRDASGGAYSLAAGDMDGDGDFDLVYPAYFTDEVVILWNDGPGVFDSERRYSVGNGPRSVALADFNNDAILDIASSDFSALSVTVMLGAGSGYFTTTSVTAGSVKGESLIAADLNGDGDPDIGVFGSTGGIATIMNNGDETFSPPLVVTTGSYYQGLAGDFDGDADLDLAAASFATNRVAVLFNQACQDSDGDGVGDPGSPGGICGVDNCPYIFNPGQEDADADGFGDVCDVCAGFDDALDADADLVPDGCDVCDGFDDNLDADGDTVPDGCDNCADVINPTQDDHNDDGTGDACCCVGQLGDANGSGEVIPTIGDISVIIDSKFISADPTKIYCLMEADVNQSGGVAPTWEDITIGDISLLVDFLFITGPETYGPLPDCP